LIGLIGVRCLAGFGRARWSTATQVLIDALEATRLPKRTPRCDTRELAGLPAPVQRYFRAALRDRSGSTPRADRVDPLRRARRWRMRCHRKKSAALRGLAHRCAPRAARVFSP